MKTQIRNIILYANILILASTSCSDYLDTKSFDFVTPDEVWDNPKLIEGVMANLYDNTVKYDDFNYWYRDAWRLQNPSSMSDEGQGAFQKEPLFDMGGASYIYEDYLFSINFKDIYKPIRDCNDFLKQLESAVSLTDDNKKEIRAEARFIRAMQYFILAKRYGGVPLITNPQEYNPDDLQSMQIPRNKEVEAYDFIVKECKDAAADLPKDRSNTGKFRADKGAALALCSRAALYAGSIAKYGTVNLDGTVGIPSSEAARFFQASSDASEAIFALGKYALYEKKQDNKAQNYCDIFLKGNGENGEYIFQKQYSVAAGKGHDWDKRNAAFSYRGGGWGCGISPTLELVESYQYTDGTDGTLKLINADGTPRRFNDPYEVFTGKDPRLFASVYMPGSPCKGTNVEWIRGVIESDSKRYQATNQPDGGNTIEIGGVIYKTSGKDGGADAGDASKTGFHQKKFFDETLTDMNMGKSETPYPLFRLGEVYLNYAEACLELGGKDTEALTAINKIRDRAGMKLLTTATMKDVRHERRIELAFEGHRFWDMKRWRIAHLDVNQGGLNGFVGTGLYPWYDIRDGKYILETGDTPKRKRSFLERNYYTRIPAEDMNSNPKLIQNPGYPN